MEKEARQKRRKPAFLEGKVILRSEATSVGMVGGGGAEQA